MCQLYNLRADPFEKATTSIYYGDWLAHRMFMLVPAQGFVAKWLESFKDFPPRAKGRASPSTTRWTKSKPTRPRIDGVAISFNLDERRQSSRQKFLPRVVEVRPMGLSFY